MYWSSKPENIEESNDAAVLWQNICDNIKSSSEEVLRFVKCKHQDWLNENDPQIKPLPETMHKKQSMDLKQKLTITEFLIYLL